MGPIVPWWAAHGAKGKGPPTPPEPELKPTQILKALWASRALGRAHSALQALAFRMFRAAFRPLEAIIGSLEVDQKYIMLDQPTK